MNLHLAVLLAYAAILMGVGLWIGRRVRNSTEFVAGQRLGPSLLFSTMLAANIGAGSTVAAAWLGYTDGASAWWWVGSWAHPEDWPVLSEHFSHGTEQFRYARLLYALVQPCSPLCHAHVSTPRA